ncbi:MAG: hypothetical protein WC584_04545 [Candidatus Pacearchaeota archaeon]
MREERNPYRTLFILTSLVSLVLIVVLIYIFAIKPTIEGYVVKKQVEASDFIVGAIISQVQQQRYVQLTYGNQTLVLIDSIYCSQTQPSK